MAETTHRRHVQGRSNAANHSCRSLREVSVAQRICKLFGLEWEIDFDEEEGGDAARDSEM